MIDEKRILAEGTVMAARCWTLESATDFILQHDKTVEKFAKIEVLEMVLDCSERGMTRAYVENLLDKLKAGK